MTRHIDFGKKGEDQAAEWLTQKGYETLHRNWRYGRYEVDIIARLGQVLHFIEVKSRHRSAYGPPEESINRKKIRNMMQAALAWRHRFSIPYSRVQFDVLAITIDSANDPEYFFIEDVSL
jgi:putative endonuclease